jgi:hypothetical protein
VRARAHGNDAAQWQAVFAMQDFQFGIIKRIWQEE